MKKTTEMKKKDFFLGKNFLNLLERYVCANL